LFDMDLFDMAVHRRDGKWVADRSVEQMKGALPGARRAMAGEGDGREAQMPRPARGRARGRGRRGLGWRAGA
jgi:hypothetical protein